HDVTLVGRRYTVVGVMPPRFFVPGTDAQLWIPLSLRDAPTQHSNRYLRVLARLAPGATLATAETELDVIARRIAQEYPADATDWTTNIMSVPEMIVGTQFGAVSARQGFRDWKTFDSTRLSFFSRCASRSAAAHCSD